MKRLILWALIYLGLYAGLSTAYHLHLRAHPRRVLFAVDSSYPMQAVWPEVEATLQRLQHNRRYTTFSVITDKGKLHSWQPQATLQQVRPYAPRNLAPLLNVQRHSEYRQADQIMLITNAADAEAFTLPERMTLLRLP